VARADKLGGLAAIVLALAVGSADSLPALARPASTSTSVACFSPHVADGDTITCAGQRVRIFGINAPEIAHPGQGIAEEPGGQAAKTRMIQLTSGRQVWCEPAGDQWDRYGRMVGRCRTAQAPDLGAQMLREGLACEWRRYDHGFYASPAVRVCSRRGK